MKKSRVILFLVFGYAIAGSTREMKVYAILGERLLSFRIAPHFADNFGIKTRSDSEGLNQPRLGNEGVHIDELGRTGIKVHLTTPVYANVEDRSDHTKRMLLWWRGVSGK